MRVREFFQGSGRRRNGRDRRSRSFFQKNPFRPSNWNWLQEMRNNPGSRRSQGWGWFRNREFFKWSFQLPWGNQSEKGAAPAEMEPETSEPRDLFEKCRKFTRASEVKKSGVYPYFCPIQSSQESLL